MFTCLPRADNAAVFAAPCVHRRQIVIVIDMAKGADTPFAIVVTAIVGFKNGVLKDQSG